MGYRAPYPKDDDLGGRKKNVCVDIIWTNDLGRFVVGPIFAAPFLEQPARSTVTQTLMADGCREQRKRQNICIWRACVGAEEPNRENPGKVFVVFLLVQQNLPCRGDWGSWAGFGCEEQRITFLLCYTHLAALLSALFSSLRGAGG